MSDVPIAMGVGALTATGKVWSVRAQGVTYPVSSSVRVDAKRVPNASVMANVMSYAYAADAGGGLSTMEKDCSVVVGYVPGDVTVIAFSVVSDDLDSGTPAIVQSIYLGSSELVTGIVTGKAGTYGFYPIVPTYSSANTKVSVKITTAPATAQAGTMTVTAFYHA